MSRLKTVTLAPNALDRNGISTTETLAAARLDYLINGALATGFDRDGICAAQTPASAAAMTLNGASGTDFTSRKGVYVMIYAGGNESGRTFTVVGTDSNNQIITENITGPNNQHTLGATRFYSITSVTPDAATAGAVEIGHNGYIDFSQAQHVAIYNAGDDSGETILVTGEDRYGNSVTDTITGASAGTSTTQNQNFGRVDRLTASGAGAGATEAGVNGKCESQWVILNYRGARFDSSISCEVSSDINATYQVQQTYDNPFSSDFSVGAFETEATAYAHSTITSKTATFAGVLTSPVTAVRVQFTAHTAGSVTMNILQAGLGGAA